MANVVALIERDHREVEDLFAKFEQTADAAVATQICDELDRHMGAEEAVVYPVIAAEVADGGQLSNEANHEHEEARQLIGRVRRTSDPDHLNELVTELKFAIQHHVQEEENELLPKTSAALDAQRLEELGSGFEAAKR
jgi:iron-sulfur cluster repair protein YtfE (RIC family)